MVREWGEQRSRFELKTSDEFFEIAFEIRPFDRSSFKHFYEEEKAEGDSKRDDEQKTKNFEKDHHIVPLSVGLS